MRKSKEFRKAAADQASAAAEYGQKALKDGAIKAQEALHEGLEHAQHWLDQAQKQAGPALKDAKVRTADFAAKRLDAVEPALREALDKITPAVDAARMKIADDLLPRLSDSLHAAAEHPKVLAETVKPKPKRHVGKTIVKVLALGTIVAGAVAAIRHFLAPKDDGWTAHEPSRAYVNNNDTFATAAKVASDPVTEPTGKDPASEVLSEANLAPEPKGEGSQDVAAEVIVDDTSTDEKYGVGSYVGDNPPAEYTIKGNERSMKYHLPGTGGYERTIAEVWFATEAAAEAAGFTKAQR